MLCEIDANIFKATLFQRMRRHVQPMAVETDGSRSRIPGSVGKLVLSFLMVKHVSPQGTTYYRVSLPIVLRILTELHVEHDGADISNWIQYPFNFSC